MDKHLEKQYEFVNDINKLILAIENINLNMSIKVYVPKEVDTYKAAFDIKKNKCKIDLLLTNNGNDELNIKTK